MNFQYVTEQTKIGYYKQNHDNLDADSLDAEHMAYRLLRLAGVIDCERPLWEPGELWQPQVADFVVPVEPPAVPQQECCDDWGC